MPSFDVDFRCRGLSRVPSCQGHLPLRRLAGQFVFGPSIMNVCTSFYQQGGNFGVVLPGGGSMKGAAIDDPRCVDVGAVLEQ